jgi:hypothetical protein
MKGKLIAFLLVLCLAFSIGFAHAKPCEPITYSGVTPDTFACMKTKLQNYGIYVPPGYNGELSGKGVAARFVYDGTSSLTIQITDKPRVVSCDTAAKEIGKFVQECQGS